MLRKALLVITAIVTSYVLTAFAGYMLYVSSEGRSEASLSIVVRFVIDPVIAILIGALIGRFSKNHPVPVAILGLVPWTVMLLGTPSKPNGASGWAGWLFPILAYLVLASAAA